MAIFEAKTKIDNKNYSVIIEVNRRGKIRRIHSDEEIPLRPYMWLDFFSQVLPDWLYTGDLSVTFSYIRINNDRYPNCQPCLVIKSENWNKKYLLNQIVSTNWNVSQIRLCAMVQWWRENREAYFKKPPQLWEITPT